MSDINPRIVDGGEPICDSDCPCYPRAMGERRCHADRRETVAGAACVEAIRRQRDEARRELCKAKEWYERNVFCESYYGNQPSFHHTPEEYAVSRGWEYLYADARACAKGGEG